MYRDKTEKINPRIQSTEMNKYTYQVKKQSGQPSNNHRRMINTDLIKNVYDVNSYQNSKTDSSQRIYSNNSQPLKTVVTSSTYGRRNQGTQLQKITVNKINYAGAKDLKNAKTSKTNKLRTTADNNARKPPVYTKGQITSKYQISSKQNQPTSSLYNSRKINNSRPNIIAPSSSQSYLGSKYGQNSRQRNLTTENIFANYQVPVISNKKKVVNNPLYRSSSPPNEMRGNISSHSIVDIKNAPKKTYVLNERKNEIIRYKVGHKRRNIDDLNSYIKQAASNHSLKVTRNVTKEFRTVADLPEPKKTKHTYNLSYNPNTTNLASRSIDATSSKNMTKKERTLTPRKLQIIKSTKLLKNKNPFEQNLRNKNNIIEIINIKNNNGRTLLDSKNRSTYDIKINRNKNDILNNKSNAIISKYDYKNKELNKIPIIEPYKRKVLEISNNKKDNEKKRVNSNFVYETKNNRKIYANTPNNKDNAGKFNVTVTNEKGSRRNDQDNKNYKRPPIQDEQKVIYKSKKIIEIEKAQNINNKKDKEKIDKKKDDREVINKYIRKGDKNEDKDIKDNKDKNNTQKEVEKKELILGKGKDLIKNKDNLGDNHEVKIEVEKVVHTVVNKEEKGDKKDENIEKNKVEEKEEKENKESNEEEKPVEIQIKDNVDSKGLIANKNNSLDNKVEKVIKKEIYEDNDGYQVIKYEEKTIENGPENEPKTSKMEVKVEKKLLIDNNQNKKDDNTKEEDIDKKEIKEIVTQNLEPTNDKDNKLNDNNDKNMDEKEVYKKEIKIEESKQVSKGEGEEEEENKGKVKSKEDNKKEAFKDNEDVHVDDEDKKEFHATKGHVEYDGEKKEMPQKGKILDDDEYEYEEEEEEDDEDQK